MKRMLGPTGMPIDTILSAAANAEPLVLGVGHMVDQKDLATLLRAFPRFRAEGPAQLVLLGDGKLRPPLQSLAQHPGIAASVEIPREMNNGAEWMQRVDLVVSSSPWEGAGDAYRSAGGRLPGRRDGLP